MFPHYVCEPQLCISVLNISHTGEQSPPKGVARDGVLSESQFFLPGSGLTKKLYFDRYASNIADVANVNDNKERRKSV